MNADVDERLDPYRATEAAVKMLSVLHQKYNDWPLVLAAYNCGPGRVNKAIREAGCRNFWELRSFLPQETQNYVPRFIAAAYVANFYNYHGLQPKFSAAGAETAQVRAVKVHESMTFGDIAYHTGISMRTIELLNPGYKRRVVPESQRGNFLMLPSSALGRFHEYYRSIRGERQLDPVLLYPNFHRTAHVVKPGENLHALAKKFRCTANEIMRWNGLTTPEVFVNQELRIFLPGPEYVAKP